MSKRGHCGSLFPRYFAEFRGESPRTLFFFLHLTTKQVSKNDILHREEHLGIIRVPILVLEFDRANARDGEEVDAVQQDVAHPTLDRDATQRVWIST